MDSNRLMMAADVSLMRMMDDVWVRSQYGIWFW